MIEYQTRVRTVLEAKETMVTPPPPAWLSGIFETGGSIGLAIETWPKRPRYESAYAYISRNDSFERTMALRDLLGGRKQLQKRDSWRWELKGQQAITTGLGIAPFSPSRRSVIEMFRQFEGNPMREKVKLAKEFRQNGIRRNFVCEEEYFHLLQNPVFTAGVFDAIGTVDATPYSPLRVQFESTNQPLLNAMKEKLGGSISVRVEPGTHVTLREASWVTVNPSLELTLAIEKSQELLRSIAPYLQMQRAKVRQVFGD